MKRTSLWRYIGLGIGSLALAYLAGCAHDTVTGRASYNRYFILEEFTLGEQVDYLAVEYLNSTGRPINPKNYRKDLEQVRTIQERIARVSHVPIFPYEIRIVEADDFANAAGGPAGKITLYSGLWNPESGFIDEGNEDQLAAVIAHEYAHATARHTTEARSGDIFWRSVAIGIASTNYDLAASILTLAEQGYLYNYGRKQEFEADSLGMMYMAAAGYDPRAAVQIWENKARKNPSNLNETSPGTHPSDEERVENLRQQLPEALRLYEATKTHSWTDTIPVRQNFADDGYEIKSRCKIIPSGRYENQEVMDAEYRLTDTENPQNQLYCYLRYDSQIACTSSPQDPQFWCVGHFDKVIKTKKKAKMPCEYLTKRQFCSISLTAYSEDAD